MKEVVSFPRFGYYTPLIVESFKNLGINVLPPPPITKRTIELGTKYSPGDVCYPFKVTLGTMIEALDMGANVVCQADTAGWCILRCYHVVQKKILEDLGYKFRMATINIRQPLKTYQGFKELNPKLSFFKVLKEAIRFLKKAKKMDEAQKQINKDSNIKIAILGEIHVCNENVVNIDVIKKLQGVGVYVDKWLGIWGGFLNSLKQILHIRGLRKYREIAWRYFPERAGGHANENLVRLVKYAEEGYDGAVFLKPFACNPETIIEQAVEKIGRDYNMPVIEISIDESTLETHLLTRIESFVDMIKLRKEKKAQRKWSW